MTNVTKPNADVQLVKDCNYSFYDDVLGKNVTVTYQSTYGRNHLFIRKDDNGNILRSYSFTDVQLKHMNRLNMKQVSFPKEKKSKTNKSITEKGRTSYEKRLETERKFKEIFN